MADVKEKLKKFGGSFFIELYIEVVKPKIISALHEWLERYTVGQIRSMVRRHQFPDVRAVPFAAVKDYLEYIEEIEAEEAFKELLIPARPDIAEVLLEIPNDRGIKWFTELREYLLEKVRSSGAEVKPDIVRATCDNCGKSWPVPRAEFDSIESCPFCGHGAREEVAKTQEQPSENTEES